MPARMLKRQLTNRRRIIRAAVKATEALISPPYTTLSKIADYVPQMPLSEFPLTLRDLGYR